MDECIGRSDCEQVCINTVGSYDCDCFDGFTFNSGTSACDGMGSSSYFIIIQKSAVDDACVSDPGCSDFCARVNGEDKCFCRNGYELSPALVPTVCIGELLLIHHCMVK